MAMSSFYNVAITAHAAGSNSDGFIDDKKMQDWMALGSFPQTAQDGISKSKANQRYIMMVAQLGRVANIYISNNVAVGANATTAATSYTFTAESEFGDSALATWDELNPGTLLTGNAAIQRAVARALVVTMQSDTAEYYDPTLTTAIGPNGTITNAAARYSEVIGSLTVGPIANTLTEANGYITVIEIDTGVNDPEVGQAI